ncbi:MAG: ATP synthase F1 subunit epsilon [Treponema sp.]|jgi:F-type H+-transporting ATPase subunit epsilon|nr:ATP synthase F1 subunit epsilon [Treponema sp.]
MAGTFTLEVHTPYRLFFSGAVEALILSLLDGEICVYAHHSPFTAPVRTGILRIKDEEGRWRAAFTTEGILEVKEKKAVLLVDAAEWPGEIDTARAGAAKQQAGETLKTSAFKFEIDNARERLARAEMRLKVFALGEKTPGPVGAPPQ